MSNPDGGQVPISRHYSQVTLVDGRKLNTHNPGQCAGEFCCIHNPSDHPLKDAPYNWRTYDGLIEINPSHMERICEHGVGHPDPDDLAFHRRRGRDDIADQLADHGCDGCCGGLDTSLSGG